LLRKGRKRLLVNKKRIVKVVAVLFLIALCVSGAILYVTVTWIVAIPPLRVDLIDPVNNSELSVNTTWFNWTSSGGVGDPTFAWYVDVIDTFTSPLMQAVYVEGNTSYNNTPLPDGDYYWKVEVLDASFTNTSETWFFKIRTVENNDPPVLSNGTVYPLIGTVSTSFNYTVNYTDLGPATYVRVYIDGTPSDMISVDGITYYYETTLGLGLHNYSFACMDNQSSVNATTTYDGPSVLTSAPYILEEVPENESTIHYISPVCNVTVYDINLDELNVSFATNISGDWIIVQNNVSSSGSNVSWIFTDADTRGETYWWRVYCNDSTFNVSETYHFTISKEWTTIQNGWFSFGNASVYTNVSEGWFRFSNTSSDNLINYGWFSFSNYMEVISTGWFTFFNISSYKEYQYGWFSFSSSLKANKSVEYGWFTFGNDSAISELISGWFSFRNVSAISEMASGWFVFSNISESKVVESGWFDFSNKTLIMGNVESGWFTFSNDSEFDIVTYGWFSFNNSSSLGVMNSGWFSFRNDSNYSTLFYGWFDFHTNRCPESSNPIPADGATGVSIYVGYWNVTITDADGNLTNGTIVCTCGNSTSWINQSDGVKSLQINQTLSYSTVYTVYLNFSDGTSNCSINETYTFTTISIISLTNVNPTNGSTGECPCCINLCVEISSEEGLLMNLTLYSNLSGVWEYFYIGEDNVTASNLSNGTYCVSVPYFNEYNHMYYWNASVSDGATIIESPIWHFSTALTPDDCQFGGGTSYTWIVVISIIFLVIPIGMLMRGKRKRRKITRKEQEQ
jgi:hypothetical protein